MMIPDPQTRAKPTLEDLLRVKRAELPDTAFWQDFERGMRQKQLAAIIEPRPWWLGLVILTRKLAPVGLPLSAGAAAMLALVAMRVSPVGGLAQNGENSSSGPVAVAMALNTSSNANAAGSVSSAATSPANHATSTVSQSASPYALAKSSSTSAIAQSNSTPSLSNGNDLASATALAAMSDATSSPTLSSVPAPRSASASMPSADHVASELNAASLVVTSDELQPDNAVLDQRQARLLTSAVEVDEGRSLGNVRERVLHRLANDESRYDSISRLGVNADRLSLKF